MTDDGCTSGLLTRHNGTYAADTWVLSLDLTGVSRHWSQVPPARDGRPPGRAGHALFQERPGASVYMFGGVERVCTTCADDGGPSFRLLQDTWRWASGRWLLVNNATGSVKPPGRFGFTVNVRLLRPPPPPPPVHLVLFALAQAPALLRMYIFFACLKSIMPMFLPLPHTCPGLTHRHTPVPDLPIATYLSMT